MEGFFKLISPSWKLMLSSGKWEGTKNPIGSLVLTNLVSSFAIWKLILNPIPLFQPPIWRLVKGTAASVGGLDRQTTRIKTDQKRVS